VTNFGFAIQRALKLGPNNEAEMFWPENQYARSQDLEAAYHDAGQFYWGTTEAWLAGASLYGEHSLAYTIPRNSVQDIDTIEDWVFAEYLYELKLR